MSRIGKQPITLPKGVEASFADGVLTIKGAKGTLTRPVAADVVVTTADGTLSFAPANESDRARALWGTFAAHAHNMITGVTEGFKKELEIEGVGYRAEVRGGSEIVLSVGFSHPVSLKAPEGVSVAVEKNLITVEGADKEVVGQFAANIRAVKKPEPYKGKGIHYVGEYIIRKQGKKAVA
ncbi:50S ribosomal protein L6 [Candidatus Kaiserbacteria bacterium]|nr:50S ribosomal protein L6 [Candidatus Kaiserbacteria bacterium]